MNQSQAAELKQAMRATFLAPNGGMANWQQLTLAALCQFCAGGNSPRVDGPDKTVDVNATLIAVGRQEVWHWLNQMLGIPDPDVAALAAWRPRPKE